MLLPFQKVSLTLAFSITTCTDTKKPETNLLFLGRSLALTLIRYGLPAKKHYTLSLGIAQQCSDGRPESKEKNAVFAFFWGRDVATGIKAGIFEDAAQIPYFHCHES
jgi:hypothetical protein